MLEARGDLFTFNCDAICIPTNGELNKKGELVMGKGCALEAKKRHPWLPAALGELVTGRKFNVCYQIPVVGFSYDYIVSFPTKNNWRDKSDIALIKRSATKLRDMADAIFGGEPWLRIGLPRPGCGNGGLDWEIEVRPLIAPMLDDRFVVLTP